MSHHAPQPTEILRHEHRVIEQVLAVVEKLADQAEREQVFNTETAAKAIDFLRQFADRCHHAKEEDLLFPALEAKGFPRDGGPTGVMLYEHEQGRGFIRQMAEAVETLAANPSIASKNFAAAARQYVELLRQHISKEDTILFVLAERTLDATEQAKLLENFHTVEKKHVGEGVHEKYVALAEELLASVGVSKDAVPTSSGFFCCH